MSNGNAIVLSGGGAKGAFQVGVLDQLVTVHGQDFSIFAGVSTGAIQALGGAMGKLPELVDFWQNRISNNENIFNSIVPDLRHHSLKDLFGALKESVEAFKQVDGRAIYDASPLRQLLHEFTDRDAIFANDKKLLLGVVSLQSGEFRTVTHHAPNLSDWVYASCSEPGLFAPLEVKAQSLHQNDDGTIENRAIIQWMDGGIRDVTPLTAALRERPDRVLVVRASPKTRPKPVFKTYKYIPEIVMRAVEIQHAEVSNNDYDFAPMYQDLWHARQQAAIQAAEDGLAPDQITRMLAPFDRVLHDNFVAPVMVIEPLVHYSKNHEFQPDKIARAIDAGRKYVEDNLAQLKAFLA